jgi:hypothetical protein
MAWGAIVLLLLAGLYVALERGTSTRERVLRWMVITGAVILAVLLGSGAIR